MTKLVAAAMESHDVEERDDPEREDIRLLQDDDTLEPTREQIIANEVKRLSPSAYQRNVVLCAVVFFFAELFELSLFAPTTALLERAICRAYYKTTSPDLIGSDGWVAEQLCRERPIQAELAVVKGWKAVFDCIPGQCDMVDEIPTRLTMISLHCCSSAS